MTPYKILFLASPAVLAFTAALLAVAVWAERASRASRPDHASPPVRYLGRARQRATQLGAVLFARLRPGQWNIAACHGLAAILGAATLIGMARAVASGLVQTIPPPAPASNASWSNVFTSDRIADHAWWMMPLAGLTTVLLVRSRAVLRHRLAETFWIALLVPMAMVAATAGDLILLFVAVEGVALADHALGLLRARGQTAHRRLERHQAAATVTTITMAMGFLLLFFACQTTRSVEMAERLQSLEAASGAVPQKTAALGAIVLIVATAVWRLVACGSAVGAIGKPLDRAWARVTWALLIVPATSLLLVARFALVVPPSLSPPFSVFVGVLGCAAWLLAWRRASSVGGPRDAMPPFALALSSLLLLALATRAALIGFDPRGFSLVIAGYVAAVVAWSAMADLLGTHHQCHDAASHWETLAGVGHVRSAPCRAIVAAWVLGWTVALTLPLALVFSAWCRAEAFRLPENVVFWMQPAIWLHLLLLAGCAGTLEAARRIARTPWRLPLARTPLIDDPRERRLRMGLILLAVAGLFIAIVA